MDQFAEAPETVGPSQYAYEEAILKSKQFHNLTHGAMPSPSPSPSPTPTVQSLHSSSFDSPMTARPAPIQQNMIAPVSMMQSPMQQQNMMSPQMGYGMNDYASAMQLGMLTSPSALIQSQLMQMQNQMSMLSQAMVSGNGSNSSSQSGLNSAKDSMLCFTLGERIGAIHKHEEHTKDSLKEMSSSLEDATRQVFELRSRNGLLDSMLNQHDHQIKGLIDQQTHSSQQLQSLSTDISVMSKEMALVRQNTDQTSQRIEQQIQQQTKKINDQQVGLVNYNANVASLQREFELLGSQFQQQSATSLKVRSDVDQASLRLQAVELHLQRDRDDVQRERKRMATELESQREMMTQQMRKIEQQSNNQALQLTQQMQQQIAQLRMELMSYQQQQQMQLQASLQSPVGGFTNFFLQILLPFLSTQKLQTITNWVWSWQQGLELAPGARRAWGLLLFGDLMLRLIDHHAPWMGNAISFATGWSSFSPSIRFAFQMLRLVFEITVVVQLTVSLNDWMHQTLTDLRQRLSDRMDTIKLFLRRALLGMLILGVPCFALATYYYLHRPVALAPLVSLVTPESLQSSPLSWKRATKSLRAIVPEGVVQSQRVSRFARRCFSAVSDRLSQPTAFDPTSFVLL